VTTDPLEHGTRAGTRAELALPVGGLEGESALDVPVTILRGTMPGARIAIVAGVHGDEYVGQLAVGRLGREVEPSALRGTLLLVPIVNPLAFRAGTRTTPADGRDLNRSFPGHPEGSVTERLAQAVMERVVKGADALVDLHGGGIGQRFMPVVGCRPEFEALGAETCRLAAAFGWGFLWGMPPLAGVLSFEACRLGVAAVGVEVGGQGSAAAAEIDLTLAALRRLLTHVGSLPGAGARQPNADPAPFPLLLTGDRTFAPASGLFVPSVVVAQRVVEGEALGAVWGLGGVAEAEVLAPRGGVVVALATLAPVRAGDFVALVLGSHGERRAGSDPLPRASLGASRPASEGSSACPT
jgi:uncharacterized protein